MGTATCHVPAIRTRYAAGTGEIPCTRSRPRNENRRGSFVTVATAFEAEAIEHPIKRRARNAGALCRPDDDATRAPQDAREVFALEVVEDRCTRVGELERPEVGARRRDPTLVGIEEALRIGEAEHGVTIDDVLELPDIAGPAICLEQRRDLGRELRARIADGATQKGRRERHDVSFAIAEGRDGDTSDGESIEEVAAERSFAHP